MDFSGRSQSSVVDARRQVVCEWLGQLDPHADSWETTLSPVVMTLVDALLEADTATLQAVGEPLRETLATLFDDAAHAREARGYLVATLAIARWGLQRLPDPAANSIARDTHAWKLLIELNSEDRLSSAELRGRLKTSDSQVSRVGRQLLAGGLVAQRRIGRTAIWELTPRGRQLLRNRGDDHQATAR